MEEPAAQIKKPADDLWWKQWTWWKRSAAYAPTPDTVDYENYTVDVTESAPYGTPDSVTEECEPDDVECWNLLLPPDETDPPADAQVKTKSSSLWKNIWSSWNRKGWKVNNRSIDVLALGDNTDVPPKGPQTKVVADGLWRHFGWW